jgi:hypothetical protein
MPVADMESVADRAIFTVSTQPMQGMSVANAVAYMEALVVNDDFAPYDWSGTSLFVNRQIVTGNQADNTYSLPTNLITPLHGICSVHNPPQAGAVVYFREPDGDIVSATIAEVTDLVTDVALVRFTTAPSASLARYRLGIGEEDYVGGGAWWLDRDMDVRLMVLTHTFPLLLRWAASSWNDTITSGSGRPAFVATTSSELIYIGGLWSPLATTSPQDLLDEPNLTNDIVRELGQYEEEWETVTLPDPVFTETVAGRIAGRGIETRVVRGVQQHVQQYVSSTGAVLQT